MANLRLTPDEIRAIHLDDASETPGNNIRDCAFFLQEVAAQLAELNENLKAARGITLAEAIAESDLNPNGHVHGCACANCMQDQKEMPGHRESCAECQSAYDLNR